MTRDDALLLLRALPPAKRIVVHRPETPRYARARAQLRYLVVRALALGVRPGEEGTARAVELACWAPPPSGRGAGFYGCFRLLREDGDAVLAALFCFYDGMDRSPGFRTESAARAFAHTHGFQEVLNDVENDS